MNRCSENYASTDVASGGQWMVSAPYSRLHTFSHPIHVIITHTIPPYYVLSTKTGQAACLHLAQALCPLRPTEPVPRRLDTQARTHITSGDLNGSCAK